MQTCAKEKQQLSAFKVALTCGFKVLIIVSVVVGLLAVLGYAIEQHGIFGSALSRAKSSACAVLLGLIGGFWNAVAISGAALSVLIWTICVFLQLPDSESKTRNVVTVFSVIAVSILLLADVFMPIMFDLNVLTIYQQLVVILIEIFSLFALTVYIVVVPQFSFMHKRCKSSYQPGATVVPFMRKPDSTEQGK